MATSRLSTRRIEWRVQVGTSNKAAQGLVIFEASVSYIPDPLAAGGPRTAIPEPVAAVLDGSGYACTPDPANPAKAGERGVALFTTDSLSEDGGDWTWTARPQLRSVNGIQMANAVPAFSFTVPTGEGSLDLAKVQKVPASPGLGTEAAVALVARAERAVEDLKGGALSAATEAVAEVLNTTDLVTGSDPRMPSINATDDLLFALRDTDGLETWLGARSSDGGPTDWAMAHLQQRLGLGEVVSTDYLLALADNDRNLTDLAIRASDGQFADFVIDRLRTRILAGVETGPGTPGADPVQRIYADAPWTPGSNIFPLNADPLRVAGWGSSSMEYGNGQISAVFTTKGARWFGGGKAGEMAEHTAARLGSVPALLTVEGGRVPSSGSINVMATNMSVSGSMKTYSGTLAGVAGTLAPDAGRLVFTRSGSGSSLAVPEGAAFIPDAATWRDATVLLWMGKNNLTSGPLMDDVIRLTDTSFDWLAPLTKRCLVLGHFVNTGAAADDPSRARIRAVNQAHRSRYGQMFLDVSGYLTGSRVWADSGITPTDADLREQELGNKPPSLSTDAGHLTGQANTAIANHLIAPRLTALGWY